MAGGLTRDQQNLVHETEQLLHEARYNPHFAETMRGRGYNEESWAHGESLLEGLTSSGRAFEKAQSAKYKATNAVRKQREQVWAHSSALAQSCVSLFQGQTDVLNALGLHARRKDGNGTSQIAKPKSRLSLISWWPGSAICLRRPRRIRRLLRFWRLTVFRPIRWLKARPG